MQVTAAHTCYLVAEAKFESYSDKARLCLVGADHWRCPRTYASPEAIQVVLTSLVIIVIHTVEHVNRMPTFSCHFFNLLWLVMNQTVKLDAASCFLYQLKLLQS